MDDYIQARPFTIQGETRQVVYMQPPSSVSEKVWLPQGARLVFGMGIDPEVWGKRGDGVEFQVAVREGGQEKVLYSHYLDPKSVPADRRWVDAEVDLGPYAHREVQVVLRTLPGASPDYDWAGWAQPKIILP